MPYANPSSNKHIPQHEHAFVPATADDSILRPTPTTGGPSHLMAPRSTDGNLTQMVPTPIPQGPPMIHRGHPIRPTGTGAMLVYVPAAVPSPSNHHPVPSSVSHHTVSLPHGLPHPSSRTIAVSTALASAMPHSVHMVPATNVDESTQATSNIMAKTLSLSTNTHSSSTKRYTAAENSNGASSDDETATTTKQDNRAACSSFDSLQAVPHSLLLLASRKHGKRKDTDSPTNTEEAEHTESSKMNRNNSAGTSSSTVPLKKRKLVSEILRTKHRKDEEDSSYHVSPVSHGSKTTGENSWSPDRSHVSHGSSYDDLMKGGQVLHENSKIAEDKTITIASIEPPKTVTTVRHFPTQLYDLLLDSSSPSLSSSQEDESVLQWCCHGKAWKIVRWDALRKSVLPDYFGGVSVDLFLSEIASWGFTEITSGTDAGAYQHTLFRRGFPNLCKEIRRLREARPAIAANNSGSSDQDEEDSPVRAKSSTPSILQVPSLGDVGAMNSSSEGESDGAARSQTTRITSCIKKEELAQTTPAPRPSESTSPSGSTWPLHPQQPIYIPYRKQEDNFIEHHSPHHPQYHQAPSYSAPHHYAKGTWVPVSVPRTTDLSGAVTARSSMSTYSPVRIRSGRGAARRPVRLPPRDMQPNPVTVTPNPALTRRLVAPSSSRATTTSYRVVSNRGRRTGSVSLMAAPSSVSSYGESTFAVSSASLTTSAPQSPLGQQELSTPAGASSTTPAWKRGSSEIASPVVASPPAPTSSAIEQDPTSPSGSLGGRPFPSLVSSASSPVPEAPMATV